MWMVRDAIGIAPVVGRYQWISIESISTNGLDSCLKQRSANDNLLRNPCREKKNLIGEIGR